MEAAFSVLITKHRRVRKHFVKLQCRWRLGLLALHLRQVALLALVGLGRAFHELQELAQGFAFGWVEIVELEANSEAGIASRHDAIKDQTFNPDFSISYPESDFELYSSFQRSQSFHEAAAQTGIRQIAPNRSG